MSRTILELVAAGGACLVSIIFGYWCWRRTLIAKPSDRSRAAEALSFFPFWLGCVAGMGVIAVSSSTILHEDRFYELGKALTIGVALHFAGLSFLVLDLLVPTIMETNTAGLKRPRYSLSRIAGMLVALLVAATVVVMAGVRFPIMSVSPDVTLDLGSLAVPATVLWLVLATCFVKLLDGIHGAALVLVLFAGVAIFTTTASTSEHFLRAYSAVVCGAAIGSLGFQLYPARLPQAGGATAFVGFVFAVLTVLARQKTVTALLIVLPLVTVALLIGGLVLSALERNLLLKKNDD